MVQKESEARELLQDGLLTIDEAVAWSRLGRSRMYDAMRDGRLRYVQMGGRRLIPRKALQVLLAENLVG